MKKNFILMVIILLLIVLFYFPIVSGDPSSKTLYPTDDTFVWQESSGSNYGDEEFMKIKNFNGWFLDDDNQMDGLIKFDVTSIPTGSTIISAKLYLYYYSYEYNNPDEHSVLELYRMTSNWNEDTVTWNTRPVYSVLTTSATVPSSFAWIDWDVTSDIQNFIDGTVSNYGWKIHDSYEWDNVDIPVTKFRTKEYGSYIPYLEIEYEEHIITVTSPAVGNIWYRGETQTITWDSENAGSYVKIELYKSGSYVKAITLSTSNDGSYSWPISSSLTTSSSYKIKITSISFSNAYDDSGYFSIYELPRYITVNSPSSGEMWYKGETEAITWNSAYAGDNVKIQYIIGSYGYTITSSTFNDGSYSWTIPSSLTTSSSYKIKITSTSYSTVYGESSYFSIDERYITVNSPYSGSKWYEGETYSITWSSKNAGSFVKIELYKSGSRVSTITSSTSNDGSYSWTVPSTLSSSSSYKIKITSTSDSNVYDESDYFSIEELEKTIGVNSPYSGDTWYGGETNTITWNSENAGSLVKIELYRSGSYVSTITSSTSNDGSHSWTIPSSLTTSSSYKIKITSISDSSVYEYSGYLTIEEPVLQKVSDGIVILAVFFIIIFVIVALLIKSRKKKNLLKSQNVKKVSKLDFLREKVKKWKEDGYNVDELEQKINSVENLKDTKMQSKKKSKNKKQKK